MSSASRSLYLLALGGCAWLALRPDARIESWIDVALAPTRVLSELCTPFSWLRLRSVRAAEHALAENEERELAERRELHEAELRAALPTQPRLYEGRRFVHAEVLGRRAGNFDALELRIESDSCEGLARGMPVTVGDAYVGRLLEIDTPHPGLAVVELVTASRFAVAASIDADAPVRCVIGGLSSISTARRGRLFLALATPSRRDLPRGVARVDETLSDLARFAPQASGFELGSVEPVGPQEWAVEPRVDYRGGLFQVVIAAPSTIRRAPETSARDELTDGAWRAVRALSPGEPNATREGFELGVGRWTGARDGAALVVGARLVARVEHAGALSSDARWLGDPGFAVHALARVEGRETPLVLGNLVSLGHAGDDGIAFAWDAFAPLEASNGRTSVPAVLFTGSGDALVPRGLVLGEADLPTGPGPHVVHLRQGFDARFVKSMWLRVDSTEAAP